MVVLQTNSNSHIFEVDNDIFENVKEYIKKLSSKKQKSFSYIDELGDKIVVMGDKEYVVPTSEDIEAIYSNDTFISRGDVYK